MAKVVKLAFIIGLFCIFCFCGKPNSTNNKEQPQKKTEKVEKNGDKKEETEAVPVQVVNPHHGDISSFLLFSSNVDTEKIVDIYPMSTGIIEKILYDEGDKVKKGTVLAILDREAVINEKRARINYQQLQLEFERQKAIFEKDMISKDEHEKLKFRLQTAKLDWEEKKLLLSFTRITSPIEGIVSKRYIKLGNRINTTELSFSVVNNLEKLAVVNIPAQERPQIFLKQKSTVISDSIEIQSSVKRISPTNDPGSGTFKVTVEIQDKKNLLAIGQFVNVKIIKKVHSNVVLLTKEALIYDGGKVFVFVIDKEKKAFKRLIKTGFEDGIIIEVTEGLTPQDQVVTAGKSSLKDKTLVKVIESVIS